MLKRRFTNRLNVLNLNHEYRFLREWMSELRFSTCFYFQIIIIIISKSSSGSDPQLRGQKSIFQQKTISIEKVEQTKIYIQRVWEQLNCISIRYFTVLVNVSFNFHYVHCVWQSSTFITHIHFEYHLTRKKMNSRHDSIRHPFVAKTTDYTKQKFNSCLLINKFVNFNRNNNEWKKKFKTKTKTSETMMHWIKWRVANDNV